MKWLLWGIFTWNRGRWTFTAPPGDDPQFTVCLKLRRFCSSAVNAWSCEWQPWEFRIQSTGRPESRGGSLSLSSNTQDRTGDGAALRDASVSVWRWAEARTSVHNCVGVWMRECVWVCLPVPGVRAQCPAVLLCPPPRFPCFSSTSVPTLQPRASIQLSNPLFSTFTHLFIYDSHLLFTATLFSFFSLFMRFIEVFKCTDVVLLHHLVQ